jgi:hypothetical protein
MVSITALSGVGVAFSGAVCARPSELNIKAATSTANTVKNPLVCPITPTSSITLTGSRSSVGRRRL